MEINITSQRVWMITGASRGFGAKIVTAALAAGDAVVATARNPQSLAEQFGNHANLLTVALDVTDEQQAIKAAKAAVERFGRVDILVNNAGYGLLGAVEEASNGEVKHQFDTNVFGVLNVTRAVLPHMRARRAGHIINISSIGGYYAYVGWGVYGATKFAVEGLTEGLAQELAPLGIYATVVEPGFFRTDFLEGNSLVSTKNRIDDYAATVGEMRNFASKVTGQQPGDPDKLAAAFIKLGHTAHPPVRLPLGTDTISRIAEKHAYVNEELKQWEAVAASTDFAAA
ncbi:oxidoreductase [Undibacterium sp.]|uniref:oxidoreductase n=1 Tax=Undibacterium sp. TaxID=1914977 RepID=UPI00374CC0D3